MSDLDEVIDKIRSEHGDDSIARLDGDARQDIEVIPTGSLNLDRALGVGGIPRGRVTEIYGPESCLAEDTHIQYEIKKPNGDRVNHKGGTIKRLYHRFNEIPTGDGRVDRHMGKNYVFYAPSINSQDRVIQNRIRDVVDTGTQEVYKVETKSGRTIKATEDHRFFVGGGFSKLSKLEVGDTVYIHNSTPYQVTEYDKDTHKEWMVKDHPNDKLPTKTVEGKYEYKRINESRAVLEAEMNGMSPDEYRERLNDGEVGDLKYIPTELHIHHKDENPQNNTVENLAIVTPSAHGKLHVDDWDDNLRYIAVEDEIANITYAGEKQTYDIKMKAPHHNYVAEDFVVHNSGKTTLATHVIAEAQDMGGSCAFVDVENAFDPNYAENLGVNTEDLLFSQPNTGEEALNIVESLVRSGKLDVIVVDSVSALVPQAEIEGDMGDQHVGLQARLMSQAMRKLTGTINETKTALIFINQIRMKVGVMYGNPETTSGGKALRFYSSVRLEIRRVGAVKDGSDIIGNETRVRVKKNKVAPPFRKAEFDIIYGEGISKLGEIVDVGTDTGVIDKNGAWYYYDDDTVAQGRESMKEWLEENPEIKNEIEQKIKEQS